MFSSPPTPVAITAKSHPSLTDWCAAAIARQDAETAARKLLADHAACVATLAAIPLTPPAHAEGLSALDHTARVLAVLHCIAASEDMGEAEEFLDDPVATPRAWATLQVVHAHTPLLQTYAILHDLGRATTSVFAQPPQGWVTPPEMVGEALSAEELHRFSTARRAACVPKSREGAACAQLFWQERGGELGAPGHGAAGAKHADREQRRAVMDALGCDPSHATLLRELIRAHEGLFAALSRGADASYAGALALIAAREGVREELFLDLLGAIVLIDAVAGRLVLTAAGPQCDVALLRNWWSMEETAFPDRAQRAREGYARVVKARNDALLAQVGLDPATVFALLETPLGPVRGVVMANIRALLEHPDDPGVDFGQHTELLRTRAREARARANS